MENDELTLLVALMIFEVCICFDPDDESERVLNVLVTLISDKLRM